MNYAELIEQKRAELARLREQRVERKARLCVWEPDQSMTPEQRALHDMVLERLSRNPEVLARLAGKPEAGAAWIR
jgi:hypothetical protein